MLRICSRALVKVRMVKPCLSVKPVSASLAAGRTLNWQQGLPSQPLPRLQQTFELYLSYLEPMMEEDELKRFKELTEEFQKAGGVGERLQRGLEWKACNTENWSTDSVMDTFHHHWMPMVILLNPSTVFPRMDFRDTKGQIRCAAELTASLLDVKTMIDNETLPVDYLRGKPLCMNQYKQIMSYCVIPGLETDSVEYYTHKHITVVHNCQFFVLEVYNNDGTPLTVDQLCVQLERICKSSLQTDTEPVGILTTGDRDTWSKTYINLIKDKTNKESLSAIQSSIFTVCLDGAMPADEIYDRSAGVQVLYGGGSQWNSGNRWFDKCLQLIIGEDGTCGANLTHHTADGTTMMSLLGHTLAGMKKPQLTQSPMEPLPVPKKLNFNITPDIKKDLEEAKLHMDKLARDTDLVVRIFDHFGKNVLKAHKMSPDAFIQMALQLAYYRMHQRFTVLEEPVSLRMFRLGRICNVNTNSPAAVTFVKAFDDPQKENSEKVDLLEKALKAHTRDIVMSFHGQNMDIHLTGLYWQAVEEKIPLPGILTDYQERAQHDFFGNQVTSKNGIQSIIGPYKRGAMNMSYSIMDDHIKLCWVTVDTSNNCTEVKAGSMIQALEDALLDMRTLIQQTSRPEL